MPYEVLFKDIANNAWRAASSGDPLAPVSDPRGLIQALDAAEKDGWRVVGIGNLDVAGEDEILLHKS